MPLALTYPGVYVQSIVQSSPPDAGVATSTAAFLGRAAKGPINKPIILNSWGDYQRYFGGLDPDSSISYQINAFFNNGGGQAIGVRLFHPDIEDPEVRQELEPLVGTWLTDAKAAALHAPAAPAAGDKSAADARGDAVASLTQAAIGKFGNEAWVLNRLISLTQDLDIAVHTTAHAIGDAIGEFAESAVPEFTARINVNLINPVYSALATVTELLQLQGAAITNPSKTGALMAAADAIMNAYVRGAAGEPLSKVRTAMAKAATVPLALEAAAMAWDEALTLAVGTPPAGSELDKTVLAYRNGALVAAQAVLDDADYQAAREGTKAAELALASVLNTVKAKVDALADADAKAAGDSVLAALSDTDRPPPESFSDIAVTAHKAAGAWLWSNWPASGSLTLSASSPGRWGNGLSVSVDQAGINAGVAAHYKLKPAELFNLKVVYVDPMGAETIESFPCLTMNPASTDRYIGAVLAHQSALVRYAPDGEASSSSVSLTPPAGAAGRGQEGRDSDVLDLATYLGNENQKSGLYALEQTPIFNILCIPPDEQDGDTDPFIYQTAAAYCARPSVNAMLIIDPPNKWRDAFVSGNVQGISLNDLGSFGAEEGRSTAVYFPRVVAVDPLLNGATRVMPNSGYIAGMWAQVATQIGVWKAPAGLDASLNGIVGLELTMNDAENGMLNPLGINCLRTFPIGGTVVWGARTLRGSDQLGDEYNYVPVRRMLLYLMDWVLANTRWAVFQPNDERLWSALRLQISSRMKQLWKEGALFGAGADQAFFVRCDATTTTGRDINSGRVNVQIGFAPVRPAEFVVVTIQQIAMSAS